jgi:oligopeptidase A
MDNPLLAPAAPGALPAFDRLRPEHAEPALAAVLADNRRALARLLAQPQEPSWESLIEPLEDCSDRLARVWGPVTHLFAVTSTPEWRAAYNAGLPKVTEYQLELSHNEALYAAYRRLAEAPAFAHYSPARKKVVADALRDFRLAGVALPPDKKARYKEIALRLSRLQTQFEENLLDAIQAWSKHVTDEAQLAGLSAQGKAQAAEKARAKNLDGYLLTLDFPSYDAVISYADDRALRRELYEAYATRASDRGPLAGRYDNGPLMEEILALRHEQARLLGFGHYAELSLQTKMAQSPQAVERFLLDLAQRARPRAAQELAELQALARRDGLGRIEPWDVAYYSEKLKQERLGFNEEDLRPYFPAPQVIEGLFALTEELYGVRIERLTGIPVWHPDVTTYALRAADGEELGLFYLDAYARADKRSGAWMDECLGRRRSRCGLQRPVAYLTCNFAPPLPGQPALLGHEEVLTLFHEFGHGLQHLLTRVDEGAVSGIRGVEWDAVELPSQFMENWAYHGPTLARFARHWRTGAPLPEGLLRKLQASRRFLAGLATLRQIEFALFDLRVHMEERPQIYPLLERVRDEVALLKPPEWNRMAHSFAHIFAGGYAAGYYSYKWAEVLSADAFAAFEEAGFSPEVGRRFRDTVLALGGSRPAAEVFREFRGRDPALEPLLRQEGLIESAPGL